MELITIKEIR